MSVEYNIIPIDRYPNNGKHLEIDFTDHALWNVVAEYELIIRKGEDWDHEEGLDGTTVRNRPHLWYIWHGGIVNSKGYKKHEDAVESALKHLEQQLEGDLRIIKEAKR